MILASIAAKGMLSVTLLATAEAMRIAPDPVVSPNPISISSPTPIKASTWACSIGSSEAIGEAAAEA